MLLPQPCVLPIFYIGSRPTQSQVPLRVRLASDTKMFANIGFSCVIDVFKECACRFHTRSKSPQISDIVQVASSCWHCCHIQIVFSRFPSAKKFLTLLARLCPRKTRMKTLTSFRQRRKQLLSDAPPRDAKMPRISPSKK